MNSRTLLRVLLCLTFLYAGISALCYLMMGMMMPQMQQLLADNPTWIPEEMGIMMERLMNTPRGFFYASALLYLLEVVGGVIMWRERWTGFHCYTLARLLLLLLPAVYLGWGFIGVGDVMFALLFILAYFSLMRGVNRNKEEQQ